MLRVAFYKATRPGLQGIYSRGVRWIDHGPYSHCELIFSSGLAASASFIDKGVRFKRIDFDPEHWDFVDVPDPTGEIELRAMQWFAKHAGEPYDLWGNVHFVFGFVKDSSGQSFCSEAVADALGYAEPWRYGPNGLAVLLKKYHQMGDLSNA